MVLSAGRGNEPYIKVRLYAIHPPPGSPSPIFFASAMMYDHVGSNMSVLNEVKEIVQRVAASGRQQRWPVFMMTYTGHRSCALSFCVSGLHLPRVVLHSASDLNKVGEEDLLVRSPNAAMSSICWSSVTMKYLCALTARPTVWLSSQYFGMCPSKEVDNGRAVMRPGPGRRAQPRG